MFDCVTVLDCGAFEGWVAMSNFDAKGSMQQCHSPRHWQGKPMQVRSHALAGGYQTDSSQVQAEVTHDELEGVWNVPPSL
jgi:hypothetical protein